MTDKKVYERVEASFEAAAADMEASVTANAWLIGSISRLKRQIDVLVDARWSNDLERRIIFDAKRRTRKVDVEDVEVFEGLMRDVMASFNFSGGDMIACRMPSMRNRTRNSFS